MPLAEKKCIITYIVGICDCKFKQIESKCNLCLVILKTYKKPEFQGIQLNFNQQKNYKTAFGINIEVNNARVW